MQNLLVSSFFIYKEREERKKKRKEKGRKINIVIEKKKHSNLRRYKSYDFKRLIKLPLKDAKREKELTKISQVHYIAIHLDRDKCTIDASALRSNLIHQSYPRNYSR